MIDDETTAALESLDTPSREIAISDMLGRAKSYLAVALQQADAPRAIADFKAEIIAVAQYAKQKRVSEEIQIDATAMVRRAERSLGVAIRDGQERGEIETKSEASIRATATREVNQGRLDRNSFTNSIPDKPRPTDYAKAHELSGSDKQPGIYMMTDSATDSEFDAALEAAKEERNLSRANVVRKIKEAKGEAEPITIKPGRPAKLNTAKTMERLTDSLWGARQSLQTITAVDADLDQIQVAAWIKELGQTSAELNRIKNLLKGSN